MLQESKLRVKWADKKIRDIELFLKGGWQHRPEAILAQKKTETRDRYFVLKDLFEEEIVCLASEFALHARCALDYIIYRLSCIDSPSEFRGEDDRTQFPVDKPEQIFERHQSGWLKHLSSEHFAMVQQLQPDSNAHPLLLLIGLSNIDKHREFIRFGFGMIERSVPAKETKVRQPDEMQMDFERSFIVSLYNGTWIEEALPQILAEVRKIVDHFDRILG